LQGLCFEDLEIGASFESGRLTITEDSVIRFAFEWDPQPFHIDRVAAEASMFGGLVASGLQTLLVSYRMYIDHGLLRHSALAGLGLDEVRFLKPMRPGDTIHVVMTVAEKRKSRKSGRGVVRLKLETLNDRGETILSWYLNALVGTRVNSAAV
jgi:acyl dehydratase